MTHIAPSFTKLFPACRDALNEARRPLHLHELTRELAKAQQDVASGRLQTRAVDGTWIDRIR